MGGKGVPTWAGEGVGNAGGVGGLAKCTPRRVRSACQVWGKKIMRSGEQP